MKTVKRMLVLLLALAMMVPMAACGGGEPAAGTGDETAQPAADEQGKVLNIYCWNEEFKSRFTDYFEKPGLIPDGRESQLHHHSKSEQRLSECA